MSACITQPGNPCLGTGQIMGTHLWAESVNRDMLASDMHERPGAFHILKECLAQMTAPGRGCQCSCSPSSHMSPALSSALRHRGHSHETKGHTPHTPEDLWRWFCAFHGEVPLTWHMESQKGRLLSPLRCKATLIAHKENSMGIQRGEHLIPHGEVSE